MDPFTMTIGGKQTSSDEEFDVVNPATEVVVARSPHCSREQLDGAVEVARAAFRSWRLDENVRRSTMRRFADRIDEKKAELAPLLTMEQGQPLRMALIELSLAARWLRVTADFALPFDVLQDDADVRVELRAKPLGVVGAIAPWNVPILLAMWKIAPALLAGNTVIVKSSPFTPLTTLRIGELARDLFPAGVLNVLAGGDELGKWMTSHPGISKISFTGSIAGGRHVATAAAQGLKRVTLELGGNDAALVLADADIEEIAERLFWASFLNTGQICAAVKRIYVQEEAYPRLLRALGDLATSVRVGDGLDSDTQMGPVATRPQLERVADLVEDARRNGARVVAGGDRLSRSGYFFRPTVLGDVGDGVRIVDEEQFGPVLPVIPFRSVDDVIEVVNNGPYGLTGSVWTADFALGAELAGRLDVGTSWVNQHLGLSPLLPFGGFRSSGIGRENGRWGLEAFLERQTVVLPKSVESAGRGIRSFAGITRKT